jgi:cystathionine beta-lyase/cystathionine gamma-synthase
LSVRVERQSANALALARFLETRPAVQRVYYPGLDSHPQRALAKRLMAGPAGAILSVDLKGGVLAVERFMQRSRLMEFAPSFADVATTWTYPARTSHRRVSDATKAEMGIGAGLIRISVGLEKIEDLIGDAKEALA